MNGFEFRIKVTVNTIGTIKELFKFTTDLIDHWSDIGEVQTEIIDWKLIKEDDLS